MFFVWSIGRNLPDWTIEGLNRWTQSPTGLDTKEMLLRDLKTPIPLPELIPIATAYSAYLKFNPEASATPHFSLSNSEVTNQKQSQCPYLLLHMKGVV